MRRISKDSFSELPSESKIDMTASIDCCVASDSYIHDF